MGTSVKALEIVFPLVPLPKKCVTRGPQRTVNRQSPKFPLVPLPKKCVTMEAELIDIKKAFKFPLVPLPKKCVTERSERTQGINL